MLTFGRELVVAKFGSNLVANGGVDMEKIRGYARGLSKQLVGHDLIVVTSGAIAAGKAEAREAGRDPEKFTPAVLASMGQSAIMQAWGDAFHEQDVLTASFLVTHHELSGPEGRKLKGTLKESIANGVIPIINENDALSDIEMMALLTGGDNDGLAAHLGLVMGAKGLRLFTTHGGVYDQGDQHIPEINHTNVYAVTRMLRERGEQSSSTNGRGGMTSKLAAACRFVYQGDVPGRWAEIAQPNHDMSGDNVTRVAA